VVTSSVKALSDVRNVDGMSSKDNNRDNSNNTEDTKPNIVNLLASSSVNPVNIPEVCASNKDNSSSKDGNQTSISHIQEVSTIKSSLETTAASV